MDNLAHTLTGTALAGAGLRRLSPLATAALVIGANVPDVDAFVYAFADEYAALAFRRGITHGVPALLLWPFLVAGALLGWDRLVRRRRAPGAEPARPGPLLVASAVAVLSHPSLDWLNTYGMRWLLPLDGRWSYGDSLFIVDPWLWLTLGAASFLAWRWHWRGAAAWAFLAAATTALILGVAGVPGWARAHWLLAVATLALAALLRRPRGDAGRLLAARALTAVAALYVAAMIYSSGAGERRAREYARASGVRDIEEVMVGPVPADPFRREVVVASRDSYRQGSLVWGRSPTVSLEETPIPRMPVGVPAGVVEAALETVAARDYLVWSRFPYVTARPEGEGWRVSLQDARYPGGQGLSGPSVYVDGDGRAGEDRSAGAYPLDPGPRRAVSYDDPHRPIQEVRQR